MTLADKVLSREMISQSQKKIKHYILLNYKCWHWSSLCDMHVVKIMRDECKKLLFLCPFIVHNNNCLRLN